MEYGQTNSKEGADRQRFMADSSKIMDSVVAMIADGTPMESVLGNEPDCIYLKSADRRMLYNNPACQKAFSKEDLMVGRLAESLVSETMAEHSKCSDGMIMSGCRYIMFDHIGHNEEGERFRMTTAKYSLLGLGHSSLAILGITRIYEKLDEESDARVLVNTLTEKWNLYMSLNPTHRDVAVELVQGKNIQEIATARNVSKRTIENHRGTILKELGLSTPLELAKLLVRFQGNGFGDLDVE